MTKMNTEMTHASLFSGIGGFDLAAEWMGWENKFHCEWNPFGQKILKHYWPHSELFTDITKSDFKKYANTIDVLTGGFPCQPYSTAGKRLGKEDERHLWPEMLRAIREVAPRYVVGENVRGITNWNGGLVFDEVCADLENLGYQVAPYLIPACAVNAPHKRERIWFVAYCEDIRREQSTKTGREWQEHNQGRSLLWNTPNTNGSIKYATDTLRKGLQGRQEINGRAKYNNKRGEDGNIIRTISKNNVGEYRSNFEMFPTQSPVCSGDDGIFTELDGITFPKWRNESIKAYGNAVVPQVVYQIFKAIQEHENIRHTT